MQQPYRQHNPATLAQARAAQPDRSVWVSANAGSGKTRVLTNRVARLLLAGAEPSRILCLTYTKAAAAEMQNRLFKTLGSWAMADDATLDKGIEGLLANDEPPLSAAERDAARRLFARALETPGGLKIQTIHAFCESLLSRFPLEAQVSPHFQVIDDLTTKLLLSEAQDRVIARRGEDPALAAALERLMRDMHEISFQDILGDILGKRATYERADADLERALAESIGAAVGRRRETLVSDWAAGIDRERLRLYVDAFAADGGTTAAARADAFRDASTATSPERLLQALSSALLTKKGAPPARGFPGASIEKNHAWALEPLARMQQDLVDLIGEIRKADRLAASAALATYARAVLAEYAKGKADRAGVDFDDQIQKAVGLLTRSDARDWVRFKLDGGVEHVLVDEAQDTSPEQWRLIDALVEEFFSGDGAFEAKASGATQSDPRAFGRPALTRSVFAVGDEKQSIYSFQGAAPELLAAMGDGFAEQAAIGQRTFLRSGLETSFRSTPDILRFVDQVFAGPEARRGLVFGADAAEKGVSHTAFRAGQPGRIEVWPLVAEKKGEEPPAWDEPVDAPPPDDPKARLADLVAVQIAAWIGKEELPARGRPLRAGDILVLVRSRGALSVGIIKRLKQLGVPVAGEDRLALNEQLAVKDLLALGRFCLFPEDDLTLASVLRSPFCDIDEDALYALAHFRRPGQPLWYALSNRREERPDFAAAHALLARLVKDADFLRPYELYALALGPLGGRPRLTARLGAEAEDPIDEFMAQTLAFETQAVPTLQAFVDWLAARDTEIKRETEQGRDEVRVMTAHGAKGLEAPVVILPDTTGKDSGGRSPVLLDPKTKGTPPIWVGAADTDPPAVAELREAHEEREAEEHRRLLYVALTRAEDRLLICGAARNGKAPLGSWYDLCKTAADALGAPFDSPVSDDGVSALKGKRIDGVGTETVPERVEDATRTTVDIPAWLVATPRKEVAPTDLSPSRLGGEDPDAAPVLHRGARPEGATRYDAETARKRGVAVHALLEHLADTQADDRNARADALMDRLVPEADAGLRADIKAEALRVLETPEFASIFGPDGRSEVPVGAILPELGPGELHGLIDRLIVTPERALIVDYKTGAIPEAPPEGYLRQLAAYRAALTRLYPDRPVDAALLWTAAPRLDVIPTSDLDAAYARSAEELSRRM